MLDLRPGPRALHSFHQRFLDDDLPPALSQKAFASFDAKAHDPREVARGRQSWTLRALDEYRSLTAFTALLGEIAKLDLAYDALGTMVRIVRDEDRHVELCRRMVVALGGDSSLDGEPAFVRVARFASARERVLRAVVGSLCIGETLSVRFLAAVRERTTDPLAREVMTALVADEAIHGRFGWELLEAMRPTLSKREVRLIEGLLPRYFAEAEAAFVPAGARTSEASHRPSPFGSLGAKERADLFDEAFRRDVLDRFRRLSLKATERRSLLSRLEIT